MDSMDEIYRRHSKMIYYFLLSKVNDPDLAEELTQETFYQALKSFHTFEGRSSVSTWLCGISGHVYQTWGRKQKNTVELDSAKEVAQDTPLEKSENWARVNFYRGKEKIIEEVRKNEKSYTL